MAWVKQSTPVSAVRRWGTEGQFKIDHGRHRQTGEPGKSIFSSLTSSVTMVKRVASEPVPAVVGMAIIGRAARPATAGAL